MRDTELLTKFSDFMRTLNRSSATITNYTSGVRRFLRWTSDHKIDSCLTVTWEDIEAYQGWLIRDSGCAISSIETYLRAVRAFYKYLRRQNFVPSDPSTLVHMPKLSRNLPRQVLSQAEIKRLINAPDINTKTGVLHRTILEVFYGTAVRLSELCNIQITDVNLVRKELTVKGKGSKERIQPLSNIVCYWLNLYIETTRDAIIADPDETALFVGAQKGRPINHQVVESIVRRYAKRARIKKKVTPHAIRATTATHMLKKGAPLPLVQGILGHQLISTTERYTRVMPGELVRAIRKHHPREGEMQDELNQDY